MPRSARPLAASSSGAARGPVRHAGRLPSHRVARAVGLVATAALSFSAAAAGLVAWDLTPDDTLNPTLAITASDLRTPDPDDPYAGNALTILIVGTDMRDAENAAIAGDADGGGSDTTMLLHISGERSWIEGVSIPRDSLVDIPACNLPDGGTSKPLSGAMFNAAFSIGMGGINPKTATPAELETALEYGTACTQSTVSALTRVPITNTILVKMTGVIGVVDALGGVQMCFDEPVVGDAKKSPDLNLPADRVTLDGRTAIEFLRARSGHGMGLETGSDPERIKRQQAFVDSALHGLLTGDLLSDVPRLYGVLGEALKSIVPDPGLDSVAELGGLAFSLRNLDTSRIVFTELPTRPAANPNRLVWEPEAEQIWERIATDQPPAELADVAPAPSAEAGDPATDPGDSQGAGPGSDASGSQAPTDPDTANPEPNAGTDAGGTNEAPEGRLPGVCYPGWVPPSS